MGCSLPRQDFHQQLQVLVFSVHLSNRIQDLFRVNPKIEVCELSLDIPGSEYQKPKCLVDGNGFLAFLLCGLGNKGAVIWNPWLNQTRWIEPEVKQPSQRFSGIGYDQSGLQTLSFSEMDSDHTKNLLKIHDLASHAWKDLDLGTSASTTTTTNETKYVILVTKSGISLHGTLYWVALCHKTSLSCLVYFNFSRKKMETFCNLPSGKKHDRDALVLRVFKRDGFSLLKQCHLTNKIEIWVTKNKILRPSRGDVEWIKFMQVACPNLPCLVQTGSDSQPSYFIDDDKKLVLCSCDENGRAWIYVVGEKNLISKIQLDSVVDPWPLHCTYFPSLVAVPQR